MADNSLFHPDYKPMPYWWEAYHPTAQDPVDLPSRVRIAIVGGGYGGLSTALEAAKHGIDCVVLEGAELGFGARYAQWRRCQRRGEHRQKFLR